MQSSSKKKINRNGNILIDFCVLNFKKISELKLDFNNEFYTIDFIAVCLILWPNRLLLQRNTEVIIV